MTDSNDLTLSSIEAERCALMSTPRAEGAEG
jgi:hypothetical protein